MKTSITAVHCAERFAVRVPIEDLDVTPVGNLISLITGLGLSAGQDLTSAYSGRIGECGVY